MKFFIDFFAAMQYIHTTFNPTKEEKKKRWFQGFEQ
jgi:hypothetical protein